MPPAPPPTDPPAQEISLASLRSAPTHHQSYATSKSTAMPHATAPDVPATKRAAYNPSSNPKHVSHDVYGQWRGGVAVPKLPPIYSATAAAVGLNKEHVVRELPAMRMMATSSAT